MKLTVNIDCTPREARLFLGMPDMESVNEMLVERMSGYLEKNMKNISDPSQFMEQWRSFSSSGLENFRDFMTAAASGNAGKSDDRDF